MANLCKPWPACLSLLPAYEPASIYQMATSTPLSGTVTPFEGFSTEQYFETQPPPSDLEARVRPAREFVERWRKVQGKKVVVVTVSTR
jgi:hypothetical protein